jgi:TetR/AcrR family transcriptional regulator
MDGHREAARPEQSERAQPPRSRAERKAASRRRILDAARDVFFRDGFGPASLDEVAERAQVAKGTLYRHVENKAELYLAVLTENGERFLEEMHRAVRSRVSSLDQLRSIGEFYLDYWSRHPEYFSIFWAVRNQHLIGHLPAKITDKISDLWSLPLRVLESVIERGVRSGELVECDPWVMAHVIWRMGNTFLDAQAAPHSAHVVDCPSQELYREGLDLILRGLAKPTR